MTVMMELAGKDVKIAIINLSRFEDTKGKNELNYEKNKKIIKTQMKVENTTSEKQIVDEIHHLVDSRTRFQVRR